MNVTYIYIYNYITNILVWSSTCIQMAKRLRCILHILHRQFDCFSQHENLVFGCICCFGLRWATKDTYQRGLMTEVATSISATISCFASGNFMRPEFPMLGCFGFYVLIRKCPQRAWYFFQCWGMSMKSWTDNHKVSVKFTWLRANTYTSTYIALCSIHSHLSWGLSHVRVM